MPRMILLKLLTQGVKRCPIGRGWYAKRSRRPRNDSWRIVRAVAIMSDLPE
jgi:hypothetical protein